MSDSFNLELVTPADTLLNSEVTEVVLPAYDGECGVLANHENFVGLLGTGALKLVRDGNDYWYMVSKGIYQVQDGKLSILTELGETAQSIKPEEATKNLSELEKKLENDSLDSSDKVNIEIEAERERARLEVHKRTSLVN